MSISMSSFFKSSDELDELAFGKDIDELLEACDSSVTITYGGDGVMLPEIFDNGAALVRSAGKQTIWLIWDSDRQLMFFFIGRLKAVMAKVKRLKDAEDEDFTAGETEEGEG